jgi:competence protein ComEA
MTKNRILRLLLGALCAATFTFAGPAFAQPVEDAPTEEAPEEADTLRVDLNPATETELLALPGIGPSKAQAIMEYRARHPFRRVEQVMRVRGVGRGIFRRIRDHIVVSQPQR